MIKKLRTRKVLKQAKKMLVKHNEIDSPIYYIRTEDQVIIHQPAWDDHASKIEAMGFLKKICRDTNASEVIGVADSFIYNEGSDIPTSDALCVTHEISKGFQAVFLPYSRNEKGKIVFGEEIWESRDNKNENLLAEGLIQ